MTRETLGSVLAAALRRAGDRVAVRDRGGAHTHAQLLDAGARFANALAGQGLRPGDRVALMVTDRWESLAAYVGCLAGGFVAVHVNDRLAAPEVDAVLADAEPQAFLYSGERAGVIAEVAGTAEVPVVVADGEPAAGRHQRWPALLEAAAAAVPEVLRAPEDLAIVGYTSGTTGRPKGVMHTQLTMLRALRHMPAHFDIRPGSRCAFTGTLAFVAGLWGIVLPHLYLGGELSFMAGLPAEEWVDRMVAERSQFTYVPTPLATAFAEQVRKRPEVLDTLATAVHSGSQLPPAVMRDVVDAIGARFVENYGMTETGAPVTRTVADDWDSVAAADDVYASVGRPVHIADVTIVDADGRPLPVGETGEISVSSDTLFAGYFRRPALTAEAVVDGRLRTGDIGRLDPAGYLYVTDRAKDMIVSGGMNVYPAEVEAALTGVPGLAEVAVIGVPDERWGETVVAVAVASGAPVDEAAVIAVARRNLASYKKPTRVVFVDGLPRTASLKVDKPELRRRWAAGELS
jgi:acyl-CoA synthetase (AMP-forming)/AMP-acid ligase II